MNNHAIDCFFTVIFFSCSDFAELLYVAVIYIAKPKFEVHRKTLDSIEVSFFD